MKLRRLPFVMAMALMVSAPAPASVALSGEDDASQSPDNTADSALTLMEHWTPAENLPAWLVVGGQIRGRVERPSGTSLANDSPDTYYASRIRVDLSIKPFPWLTFFAEGQDARTGGYNLPIAPTTLYNPLDLRQGFMEIRTKGRVPLKLKVGRQELSFGGERVIGPADWGMSRTFDALDLTVGTNTTRVDFLAGSAVAIDSTRFDRHKPGEHFYGAYGSLKELPCGINVEPYVLFKQTLLVKAEDGVIGDALVVSPGVRLYGTAPGRFDYIAELLVQRGSYSADRVQAFGQSYVAGWTVADLQWRPRLSGEYSYASGDANSTDGVRGTFDQFYPSNHGYYGMIDQFGWKNLKNWRAGFDCRIGKKIKVRTDYNQFFLATVQDALYNSSGSSIELNRKATSSNIGWETNTVAVYERSVWKFGAGYGHLFAGDYLKQSKLNFGYSYPYVFFTRNL